MLLKMLIALSLWIVDTCRIKRSAYFEINKLNDKT